jgi:hypothetical protein
MYMLGIGMRGGVVVGGEGRKMSVVGNSEREASGSDLEVE